MDKCPFCGAKPEPMAQGWREFYTCKTGKDEDDEYYRGASCYEAELQSLRRIIREMADMIEYVLSPQFYAKSGVRRRKPLEEILNRPEFKKTMEDK